MHVLVTLALLAAAPPAPAAPAPAAPAAPAFEGQLAGSGTHACLLRPAHDVVCWGLDLQNVRGPAPTGEPEKVAGLDDAQEIAVGLSHGCAVRTGGKVSCWGHNGMGQLGVMPEPSFHALQDVPNLEPVAHIAANGNRTCVVTVAGTVSCWGSLDPSKPRDTDIVQMFGLTDVKQIAMGDVHVCALQNSGHVLCWGDNMRGEVGNGQRDRTAFGVNQPTLVVGLDDATAISAGRMDTCALRKNGSISCWGDRAGAFAPPEKKGGSPYALFAVPVPGAVGAKAVMVTEKLGCLLKAKDSQLACWWPPFEPQSKADFAKLHPAAPKLMDIKVPELAKATRALVTAEDTYALVAGGKVLRWGGRGARLAEEPVKGIKDAVMVSTGANMSCAVRANGQVLCWGAVGSGMESSGVEAPPTAKFSSAPVPVAKVKDIVAVSVGAAHACALDKAGAVWCWGNNASGQLGNGKKGEGLTGAARARAHITDPIPPPELLPREGAVKVKLPAKAIQVAAGGAESCAVLETGALFCWGANAHGQLGNGGNANALAPIAVAAIPDAARVAVGDDAACAVRKDGSVWCWGKSKLALFADGTDAEDVRVPTAVPMVTGAVDVAVGLGATCAVKKDGTAACWGKKSRYLGDEPDNFLGGAVANAKGIADAASIAMGADQRCVRRANGAVACWGRNLWGVVGDGTRVDRFTPVEVIGLGATRSLSAGLDQTCAVKSDGQVVCWGAHLAGGLGTGIDPTAPHPVALAGPAPTPPAPPQHAPATPAAAHP